MKIDHCWLFLDLVDPTQRPCRHAVGKQAKITTARYRAIHPKQSNRRRRKLIDEPAAIQRTQIRESWRFGYTIIVMNHREYARIIIESFFGQNVQRPQRVSRNRIARGTITLHRTAQRIFDGLLSQSQIFAKIGRSGGIYHLMSIAMTSNLVSFFGNLKNQTGKFLGHPTQDEKRRLNLPLSKYLQQAASISFHPARVTVPIVPINNPREGMDVKVVLNVHCQSINHDQVRSTTLARAFAQ